ncbi:MAG: hypothetical protein RLW62_06395, partial [Gammaproteobacteria bacterium]
MMTDATRPPKSPRTNTAGARQALRARALVAGLAPSVMPMIIRERRGDALLLAFDGQSGALDERWASDGAGLVIIFKAGDADSARRVSLLGRLRARGPRGIEVGLVALDDDARGALASLASGTATSAAPIATADAPTGAPEMTADAIASLCLAAVRQLLPGVGEAYLDGLAAHLAARRAAAQSDAEDRRFGAFESELAAARPRLHEAILAEALPSVAAALSEDERGGGNASGGGLSLLESIDLRATLLVTEAVESIAAQLRQEWLDLEPRLAQIAASRTDVNALAPAVFCHRFRDAIFFDHQFGALRQADLAAGFSADFVTRLAGLYRTLAA